VRKIIVITGGAGFVGSNLIEFFLKKTRYRILSIDNYSSGFKRNEIRDRRVKYVKGDTKNISKILNSKKRKFIQYFILGNFQEYIKVF
jgi:UDP-glucose 4-epimerase